MEQKIDTEQRWATVHSTLLNIANNQDLSSQLYFHVYQSALEVYRYFLTYFSLITKIMVVYPFYVTLATTTARRVYTQGLQASLSQETRTILELAAANVNQPFVIVGKIYYTMLYTVINAWKSIITLPFSVATWWIDNICQCLFRFASLIFAVDFSETVPGQWLDNVVGIGKDMVSSIATAGDAVGHYLLMFHLVHLAIFVTTLFTLRTLYVGMTDFTCYAESQFQYAAQAASAHPILQEKMQHELSDGLMVAKLLNAG